MRKIIPALLAGGALLAAAGGTFGYAIQQKDVTVAVDGVETHVETRGATVADVLAAARIGVGSQDVVAPALDAAVADGTRIAVRYGRLVHVNVDGQPVSFWTTATTVDQALAGAGLSADHAELSTSRGAAIGRQGLTIDMSTEKRVVLDVAGNRRKISTTAATVGEALTEAGVVVDLDDTVDVALSHRLTDNATIVYTKVDSETRTRTEAVAYRVVRKTSAALTRGTTKVVTAGREGRRTITYRVVLHNGKVVKRSTVSRAITRRPVARVLLIGTKARTPAVPSGSVWDRIARCESGGNWQINTGNGFYGGLQFTLSTWRAFGGSGMPHHASREQQIAVAKRVQASQGWGAWPACTRKLGLR